MAINKVLYSSENGVWETPQDLFNRLNDEFHFDIDVCAPPENAKCSKFFSPLDDGLSHDWQGVCWMNPPYGKKNRGMDEEGYGSKDNRCLSCTFTHRHKMVA